MVIKTPTELIKRLNELRQQNPRAYAHVKINREIDQDSGAENQPSARRSQK